MIAIQWNYTEGFGDYTEQKHDSAAVETLDELEDMQKFINEDYNRIISEEGYKCKVDSIEYFQCTAVDNPKECLAVS
ncbi:MAG: hypothetical protein K0S80_1096 [Neobacillus sp.]|nr:hypothetical protein [Neobacillus sp.]